jgi:hypothetical protein
VFGFARQALIAACHEGPWRQLDDWHPRCDPRIPLIDREPVANYGCYPARSPNPYRCFFGDYYRDLRVFAAPSLTATLSEGGRTGDPSAITSLTAMADGGGTSSGGVVLFLFAPLAIGLVAYALLRSGAIG